MVGSGGLGVVVVGSKWWVVVGIRWWVVVGRWRVVVLVCSSSR